MAQTAQPTYSDSQTQIHNLLELVHGLDKNDSTLPLVWVCSLHLFLEGTVHRNSDHWERGRNANFWPSIFNFQSTKLAYYFCRFSLIKQAKICPACKSANAYEPKKFPSDCQCQCHLVNAYNRLSTPYKKCILLVHWLQFSCPIKISNFSPSMTCQYQFSF